MDAVGLCVGPEAVGISVVGLVPTVGVAVATMIHGVCVGCTWATSPAAGVAVTTTIQGVWVGGGTVGSGVPPQAPNRPAIMQSATSTGKSLLMLVCHRSLKVVNGLIQCCLRLFTEPFASGNGLNQGGIAVFHVAQ